MLFKIKLRLRKYWQLKKENINVDHELQKKKQKTVEIEVLEDPAEETVNYKKKRWNASRKYLGIKNLPSYRTTVVNKKLRGLFLLLEICSRIFLVSILRKCCIKCYRIFYPKLY